LRKITRYVAKAEIRRLQEIARDHFYVYDVKNVELRTLTMQEVYDLIMERFRLSNAKSNALREGLAKKIGRELIAGFGQKNVRRVQENNKISYQVLLENADYNNITRKRRKDNLIKQRKEKVKVSIQLDRDLRDSMRDYCLTKGVTMSNIVREHFKRTLEDDYYSIE